MTPIDQTCADVYRQVHHLWIGLEGTLPTWQHKYSILYGPPVERPPTFIGSPCEVDADCTYECAVCLTDGFPGGSCSLACDRFCPDLDGFPTTFCVAKSALPSSGSIAGCVQMPPPTR